MTTHWPSQDIHFTKKGYVPPNHEHLSVPKEVPEIAKTTEAKQLAGAVPYNFRDGRPTALDQKPKFDLLEREKKRRSVIKAVAVIGSVVVVGLAYLVYRLVA